METNLEMRSKLLDNMKGLTIALVVLAHSGFPYSQFICLFHMPVFFIFSGYCHRDFYSENLKNIVLFTKKRLKSLYVPYVFFNLLLIFLHNAFYRLNLYTDNPLYIKSDTLIAGFRHIGIYSVRDFVYHTVLTVGFVDGEQLAGTLWFLRTLFEVSILYVLLDLIARKLKKYREGFIAVITLSIMLTGYILNLKGIHIITGLEDTCYYFIFFVMGVFLHKWNIQKVIPDAAAVIISAVWLLISYQLLVHSIVTNTYSPAFYISNGCMGGILIKGLVGMLMQTPITGMLEYMGRNSLHIMLWHFTAFKLVSFCYIKIYDLPMYYLASFPVLRIEYWWILYFVVGVILPLLGVCLVNTTKEKVKRED